MESRTQYTDLGLEARIPWDSETWKQCPTETSKKYECLQLKHQVFKDKSIDPKTGLEKQITYNGNIAFNQYQAQRACKHLCWGICKSFNLKKFNDRQGFTCTFYSSVVDDNDCVGNPGEEFEPVTTYMKYDYGDCKFAEKNTTRQCCHEDYL